jgi:hypothetical protein
VNTDKKYDSISMGATVLSGPLVEGPFDVLKHYERKIYEGLGVPAYYLGLTFEGVPMADKGYFTYCTKHRDGRGHMNMNYRKYAHQHGHGFALAFDHKIFAKMPFQDVASSIAGIPLLKKLFPFGFLVAQFPKAHGRENEALVATDSHWMIPPMDDREADIGLFTYDGQLVVGHFTDTSELTHTCYSIERVVNICGDCRKDREECTRERLVKWAESKNIPTSHITFLSPSAAETKSVIDGLDEEQLDELLRNEGENSAWEYIHPNKTSDQVRKDSLRGVFDHNLHKVEEYAEKRSEASRKAAETRSLLRVCEAECIFSSVCPWVNSNYKSGVRDCHGTSGESRSYYIHYGGGFPRGPYRQNDVDRAIDWYLEHRVGVDPVMLKVWSTIAYNAGVTTRATGRPMTLCGVNESFNGAVFVTENTRSYRYAERKEFSFEDTLRILRTPYIEDHEYRKARGIAEPPRMLNRDELALYVEIIQHTHLAGYQAGMFGRITPLMKSAEWDPTNARFTVCGISGYSHWVSKMANILTTFEQLPKCVRFIPESAGTRLSASSPGRPL